MKTLECQKLEVGHQVRSSLVVLGWRGQFMGMLVLCLAVVVA